METAYIPHLQEQLRFLSLMDDHYLLPDTDGHFGEKTADAVRAFQQVNGLPVTGTADADTLSQLEKLYGDYLQLTADPQPICPFPSPYFVMREGESGPSVHILQAMLAELCSDFTTPAPPAVNGHFDEATRLCVARWQSVLGLPENGEVDRFCWDRLADVYNMRLL